MRPTDIQSVLASEAYLLFYERHAPFELAVPRAPGAAPADAAEAAEASAESGEQEEHTREENGDSNGNGHAAAAAEGGTEAAGDEEAGSCPPTDGDSQADIVTLSGSGAPPLDTAEEVDKAAGVKMLLGAAIVGVDESVHGGQQR